MSRNRQYWDEVRRIAEDEDISVTNARRRWREIRDERLAEDSPPANVAVSLDLRVNAILENDQEDGLQCPYCFCSFHSSESVSVCSSCSTRVHTDCASEFGSACPGMGCGRIFSFRRDVDNVVGEEPVSRIVIEAQPNTAGHVQRVIWALERAMANENRTGYDPHGVFVMVVFLLAILGVAINIAARILWFFIGLF